MVLRFGGGFSSPPPFFWVRRLRDAIKNLQEKPNTFVYGMSDRRVGGLDLKKADGHMVVVQPDWLVDDDRPEPFKAEPSSLVGDGGGPTSARPQTGSSSLRWEARNGEPLIPACPGLELSGPIGLQETPGARRQWRC